MIYQRLDESQDQTRVVSILPEGVEDERLRCSIETVSLVDYNSSYKGPAQDVTPTINKRDQLAQWWREIYSIETRFGPRTAASNMLMFAGKESLTWQEVQDGLVIAAFYCTVFLWKPSCWINWG